jgi:DNA-binding PadR family transcriptional regulator
LIFLEQERTTKELRDMDFYTERWLYTVLNDLQKLGLVSKERGLLSGKIKYKITGDGKRMLKIMDRIGEKNDR